MFSINESCRRGPVDDDVAAVIVQDALTSQMRRRLMNTLLAMSAEDAVVLHADERRFGSSIMS